MHTHDRMVRLHRLATDELAIPSGALGLRVAIVFGCEALQQLLDWLREALVGRDLAHPSRIATSGWDRQQGEHRECGRLVLVRDVRMVACGGELGGALLQAVEIVGAEVDVVELDVIFYVGTDGLIALPR